MDGTTDAAATMQPRKKDHRKAHGTGKFFDEPCERCEARAQPCEMEEGGGACVRCCKAKGKCRYSGPKGNPRQKQVRHTKDTKVAGEKGDREVGKPKKSKAYVEVTEESASEPLAKTTQCTQAPAAKAPVARAPTARAPAARAPAARVAAPMVPAPSTAAAVTFNADPILNALY